MYEPVRPRLIAVVHQPEADLRMLSPKQCRDTLNLFPESLHVCPQVRNDVGVEAEGRPAELKTLTDPSRWREMFLFFVPEPSLEFARIGLQTDTLEAPNDERQHSFAILPLPDALDRAACLTQDLRGVPDQQNVVLHCFDLHPLEASRGRLQHDVDCNSECCRRRGVTLPTTCFTATQKMQACSVRRITHVNFRPDA